MASINSVTQTPTTTAATPTSAAQATQNQFLQLLVAQLKDQDPTNPVDGTQFVSQLAQISSLTELTGMHSDLDSINTDFQSAAAQNATAASTTAATAAQTAASAPQSIFS